MKLPSIRPPRKGNGRSQEEICTSHSCAFSILPVALETLRTWPPPSTGHQGPLKMSFTSPHPPTFKHTILFTLLMFCFIYVFPTLWKKLSFQMRQIYATLLPDISQMSRTVCCIWGTLTNIYEINLKVVSPPPQLDISNRGSSI